MSAEEIDIDFIKTWLKTGEITKLAEEEGISRSMGYKILRSEVGKRSKNYSFLLRCYRAALNTASQFVAFEEQKKSLVQKKASL